MEEQRQTSSAAASVSRVVKQWETSKADDYRDCQPPHAEWAMETIKQYCFSKFPDYKSGKIPFAMDIACGSGQFSELLGDFCGRVIASDISPYQVELARKQSTHQNVSYQISSVLELSRLVGNEEEDKADLITAGNASHYFNDNTEFYIQIRRSLKRGGILAESTYKIVEFPGYPAEAYEKHFEFWKAILTSYGSNKSYTKIFDHVITCYKNMKVFLEHGEIITTTHDLYWTKDQLCSYLLFTNMKNKDYTEEVVRFYDKLWEKYKFDEKLFMRVQVDTLFSQNMKAKK